MPDHERIFCHPCGCRSDQASGCMTAVCKEHEVARASEIARENARLHDVIEAQAAEIATLSREVVLRALLADFTGGLRARPSRTSPRRAILSRTALRKVRR